MTLCVLSQVGVEIALAEHHSIAGRLHAHTVSRILLGRSQTICARVQPNRLLPKLLPQCHPKSKQLAKRAVAFLEGSLHENKLHGWID